MVKLASARESRMYGPRLSRNRSEYMNAGLYVFATILLTSGFVAQLSSEPKSGLVLLLISLAIIIIVNVHDLIAHLAAIDYRLDLVGFDLQLGLVEFAVPVVYTLGTVLFFIATLFLFIQAEKEYGYFKLERHALNMFVAGPILWLLGSIHNSCQFYERADGHVQILQDTVQIPFLLASLLFLVGSVLNRRAQIGHTRHGLQLLGDTWTWLGIFGSLILFIGALANVVRVFKMQQIRGLRLEKLRGGAQERLIQIREGHMPLIGEEQRRLKVPVDIEAGHQLKDGNKPLIVEEQRRMGPVDMDTGHLSVAPTPYKDVLVRHT